ncbi:MAG TPA: Gfo/Idh/MocA family oxidoreductase [Blastocatellia bacterium]|nr:Gfo/Idh/MocA family oxidoreductase [Blastocatellia bacterium]HMV84580.1 Gfo/Idh/MocA family oxidoreductase [Blastocatellia bacterium]HMX29906.1 Gfo/Idh/MocA family oxidoreductase [Blastocatellia bacterium]HMY70752.1 Gfo/Idh/MocA family oxidoreductase [Blastocatellia bacterium]HMZ18145.1 Gfo/Idh/MocA family oxidoreductase [Blastocatellia bacterium]
MSITRRTFLETAGATLAAGAVLRANEPPLRVAVIGTGGRGSDLIRALTTIDGVELIAVCDDYPPHLEQGAKYAGPQARTYADYRRLLDEAKPQAVVIAVPLYLHYQIAADCLSAGADVFLEKTMCYAFAEAKKLVAQVAASKRVFQVGLQRRANAIYKQAQAMVAAGMIGQVTAIKSQWHRNNSWRRPVPVPKSNADWTKLEKKLNWRLYKAYSQGLMAELGSHQMDVANWFLGAHPKRVIASGGIEYFRDGREVYDNINCLYEYELQGANGKPYTVRATYSSLCNNAYEGASELILGTKGSLYLTSAKGLLFQEKGTDAVSWEGSKDQQAADANAAVVTAGKTLKLSNDPWAHRGAPFEIDIAEGNDTRDELVAFVDCVRRQDTKTICDAQTGLTDCATILMANQSVETGGWISFPV